MTSSPLALDPTLPYRELRGPPLPDTLRELALACFAAQRRAMGPPDARAAAAETIRADPSEAADAVSKEVLEHLLARGRMVGGGVTDRRVASAIPFNARHTRDTIRSREVAAHRRRLDAALARWLPELFPAGQAPLLAAAGHWWYPPGTSFGWHTNHDYPGWRLYLSHAEEADRSFFRYRHPESGEVVTSRDGHWDLRSFEVSTERPFWHAIHSDTNRFSVGWIVRPWSVRGAAVAILREVLRR